MEVVIQANANESAAFVARIVATELQTNPRPVLGLATGRTMEWVYADLVKMHRVEALDFSTCHTFNLDEYVGLDESDPNSYRRYMEEHLFGRVNIHNENTQVPNGTAADLDLECARYESLIKAKGGIDVQLLGIGQSGHIGFNEPPSATDSRTRVVALAPATIRQNAENFGGAERMPRRAITMGVGTILECRRCVLLATGKDKAGIVAQAIEGPMTSIIPATALQSHPNCMAILDEAAADGLKRADYYRSAFKRDPKWDHFRDRSHSSQIAAADRSSV